MVKSFQRTIENFACQHCEAQVIGNGYTNHCPRCLWSKHVDKNPGDRAHECKGLMKPIGTETKSGEYILTHQCTTCGLIKKNKSAPEDDFDDILKLTQTP